MISTAILCFSDNPLEIPRQTVLEFTSRHRCSCDDGGANLYCLTEFDPLLQVEVRQSEKRASECVFSIFLTTTFLAALVDLLTHFRSQTSTVTIAIPSLQLIQLAWSLYEFHSFSLLHWVPVPHEIWPAPYRG